MKTQMQLANRAWRTETQALGWRRGWKNGRKEWKDFCRSYAKITVSDSGEFFHSQEDAKDYVRVELSYWD